MKILLVAGTRPNFIKILPLWKAFRRRPDWDLLLVHTEQHYDYGMNQVFFEELDLPRPAHFLHPSGKDADEKLIEIQAGLEKILRAERPRWVVVVGDVHSTAAAAVAAKRVGLPLAHVEAGLRSFDLTMPEEKNRLIADHLSEALFVTEPSGMENLRREGVADARAHLVGNVMIDCLREYREKARARRAAQRLGMVPGRFVLATLHRPSNVDLPENLARTVAVLEAVQGEGPVLFPVHPRTLERLRRHGLEARLAALPQLKCCPPLGYLDFMSVLGDARAVVTDSGGVQEEAAFLEVPCFTLRTTTERPLTLEYGTNRLLPFDPEAVVRILGERRPGKLPADLAFLWDGRAAERVAEILAQRSR